MSGADGAARRPARAWKVVALLIVLIAAVQVLAVMLAARREAPPPTVVADAALFADARAPTAGPATADVTIVWLSDYACPNCRAMHADLRDLLAHDRRVRIVYRDWPILGDASRTAARLAVGSAALGRHAAFDDELMRRGGALDETALRRAAANAGIDPARLDTILARDGAAIDALLGDTQAKAAALGLAGTPVVIVGPYLVQGRQSAARLRDLVAMARAARARATREG